MFTPAFENDADLQANTTTTAHTRKPSELYVALQDMPVSETWHQVDSDAFPDVKKFRIKVSGYSKKGAGKFKSRSTAEGVFIKKVAETV